VHDYLSGIQFFITFLFKLTSMNKILILALLSVFLSCARTEKNQRRTIGTIQRFDRSLDAIIDADATPQVIADGFKWTEGPVWVENRKILLFSDVFANAVFKWTEEKGAETYLKPSGYTASSPRGGELGSNGLVLSKEGKLILCQHGNRQVAMMTADIDHPKSVFTALANKYQGKRFNSPNDATFDDNGDLFFTDPPYGLEGKMQDPQKELTFQGVYKVKTSGEITLMCDTLSRPNGIAFFPDHKRLIVANSDSTKPYWYSFDVDIDKLTNGKIFYNASSAISEGKGLPDGLKIDNNGNVFAAGPAGVFIFNKDGKLLGKIKLPVAPANCALSADEKTLFITATNYVLRLKMRK
jgi:gluconolactonase